MSGALASSFRLQSTIVHALMMQDMNSRYAQSRLGVLTAIAEPMVAVFTIYLFRVYLQGRIAIHGVPMLLFIVTGYMTYFCFRLTVNQVTAATARKSASRMLPQVTSMDAIVAKSITSLIIYSGVMITTFLLVYLYSGIAPTDVLMVLLSTALALALALPVGIIFGVIIRWFPVFRMFVGLLLRVNLVLSGALFMASEVPIWLLNYVGWNPLFHVVEIMREGWFPGYVSPVARPDFVVVSIILFTAIALSLERVTSRFKFS